MFEKIVLRRSENGSTLTLGELAQAMLFYEQVHIVFDRDTLIKLIQAIGTDKTLALISRRNISSVFVEDELSVYNVSPIYKHYDYSALTVMGDDSGIILPTPEERLASQISRFCGISKSTALSFAVKFFNKVRCRTYISDFFVKGGILNAARSELADTNLLHESTRRTLAYFLGVPDVGDFKIRTEFTTRGFTIHTDLDFNQLNNRKKLLEYEFNLSHLLLQILIAKSDDLVAANYDGDIYTSPLSSQIISIRHQSLIQTVTGNKNKVALFEELIIPNAAPIKELLNSKQKTFDEFLILLDKAEKFRHWAHGLEPESSLALEYMKEINAKSWIEHPSVKTLRFMLSAGVGAIEPLSGLALSVTDTFLLDKLVKGWRPNQFIEKEFVAFIRKN